MTHDEIVKMVKDSTKSLNAAIKELRERIITLEKKKKG